MFAAAALLPACYCCLPLCSLLCSLRAARDLHRGQGLPGRPVARHKRGQSDGILRAVGHAGRRAHHGRQGLRLCDLCLGASRHGVPGRKRSRAPRADGCHARELVSAQARAAAACTRPTAPSGCKAKYGCAHAACSAPPTLPCAQHREHYIDGRRVDANAAVPNEQGGGKQTRKLFVGGLGDVSDSELRAHFMPFGSVSVSRVAEAGVGCCGSRGQWRGRDQARAALHLRGALHAVAQRCTAPAPRRAPPPHPPPHL